MQTPRTVGRFEVLQVLGDGGFGPVLRGRDPAGGDEVSIQLCTVDDPEIRRRFYAEAAGVAKLRHAHVVEARGVGFEDEAPYLAQELVPRSLDQVLEQRPPWSAGEKLALLLQVVRGMSYAHSRGFQHLDLRPEHIALINMDGRHVAKVAGLGLARLAAAENRSPQQGVTLATAIYLPPEQVRGGEVDQRVDLFAFGVMAYELLTYEQPFRGQNLSALVYQVLYKEPQPMSAAWGDCPASLEKIIGRCLAKDPDQRYQTFDALLTDLDGFLRQAHGRWAGLEKPYVAMSAVTRDASDTAVTRSQLARTALDLGKGSSGVESLLAAPAAGPTTGADILQATQSLPALGEEMLTRPSPDRAEKKPGETTVTLPSPPVAIPPREESRLAPPAPADELSLPMDQLPTLDELPTMTMQRLEVETGEKLGTAAGDPAAGAPAAGAPAAGDQRPGDPPDDDELPTMMLERLDVGRSEGPTDDDEGDPPDDDELPTMMLERLDVGRSEGPTDDELPTMLSLPEDEEPTQLLSIPVPPVGPSPPPTPKPVAPPAPPTPTPPAPPTPPTPAPAPPMPRPPAPVPPAPVPQPPASTPPAPTPAIPEPVSPLSVDSFGSQPLVRQEHPLEIPVAGPAEAPRTAAPVAPAPRPASGGRPMALVAVVVLLAVVVLAVAGWWLWGRGTSDERVAETTANETPPPTRTEPIPGQPLGRLVVTAAPWARLVEISNEGGFLQDLPADRHTPLTLELAPGTYRITLEYGDDPLFFAPAAAPGSESVAEDGTSEPSGDPVVGGVADDSVPSSDPQTCEVVVATTTVARCDLVFEGPEALDYFKEAGWWQ